MATNGKRKLAGGSVDPLVVRCEDIEPYVTEFVKRYNAQHPLLSNAMGEVATSRWNTNADGKRMPSGYGGIHYLAERSGVAERNISGIISGKQKHTSLTNADAIMSAIGYPLSMLDIRVVPNPLWNASRWLEWSQNERGTC